MTWLLLTFSCLDMQHACVVQKQALPSKAECIALAEAKQAAFASDDSTAEKYVLVCRKV